MAMLKNNLISIKKIVPLAVLAIASVLVGCSYHGDLDSSSACALPQELCGTWITEPQSGPVYTLADGQIGRVVRQVDGQFLKKITISSPFIHTKTLTLDDGRTAYLAHIPGFSFNYFYEGEYFANLSQEKKKVLSSFVTKDFEAKGFRCFEAILTQKTMKTVCQAKSNDKNGSMKMLLTLEQGRLCHTEDTQNEGKYPTKPDKRHLRHCMRRP